MQEKKVEGERLCIVRDEGWANQTLEKLQTKGYV
jgi:hypothetical protein